MDWYKKLRWKLSQSECKAGYFNEPIIIECRTFNSDGSTDWESYPAKNVCLKGEKIIASGNRCPQVHITDEDTLKKMYRAFKPCKLN